MKTYRLSYTFALLLLSFPLYAAPLHDLTTQNPSWNAVISGSPVCAPQPTSYGFAVLTDGRMISAFTDSGTVLWQRAVPGRPDDVLTVLDGDFLLTVSGSQVLSLVNPGGLTLWSVSLPFEAAGAPFCGRDGRIFIRGRNDIACYGTGGVCKWHTATERQSILAPQELTDGSIVLFLEGQKEGKSCAVRISPFGETLEDITFAGAVSSALSCNDGILLSFSGGGEGMCMLKDNHVVTAWGKSSGNTNNAFFLNLGTGIAAYVQTMAGKAQISCFRTSDGTVLSVSSADISIDRLSLAAHVPGMSVIADDSKALWLSSNGTTICSAQLPPKESGRTSWDYLSFTPSGYLVISSKSWTVSGWRLFQDIGSQPDAPASEQKDSYLSYFHTDDDYSLLYSLRDDLDSSIAGNGRIEKLKQGMYGADEIGWTSDLLGAVRAYLSVLGSSQSGGRTERSVFLKDAAGTDSMLAQLSCYGTNTFPPLIARLITSETNLTHMRTLLVCAASCGYDPDGSMLGSLQHALARIPPDSDQLLVPLCDAVFGICRFMSRPAFYSRGKDILVQLLYPQYSSRVRSYARTTLTKIAALKI